jgi:cytidylate kinase
MSDAFVIAVDGPAASGKSTVAEALARRLGALLIDSGLYYRALAWLALQRGVAPSDGAALAALAGQLSTVAQTTAGGVRTLRMLAEGRDVTGALHGEGIERIVSLVAREPRVRAALLEPQRRAVADGCVVVAGRDIGTVVFPDAWVKVYLAASASERARRRAAQRGEATPERVEEALKALLERDRLDAGQMLPADDAITIDTDGLKPEDVVERVARLAEDRRRGVGDGGG